MRSQSPMPVYITIAFLTIVSACGLLGGGDSGSVFKVIPISAVEVALEVSGFPGDKIRIKRDGNEMYSFKLNQEDTVIY